jgi:pyridinium-3,5-biscarboxylic acid mononucleotide sulfurtransferase
MRDALPDALTDVLAGIGPMVVAFSGGVDSTFLAVAAQATLGADTVEAVTAVSASLGADELARCRRIAREWALAWSTVATDELADERYLANADDRCYWCKTHLMDELTPLAAGRTVVLGVNVDDLGDHRPGQRAARERGARFPLVEAGLSKADVRELSRRVGLDTWDQPASPCLSSRLPYGTPVTLSRLSQVERAERGLRRLGLRDVRVRHHGDVGLVEVPVDDVAAAATRRDEIVEVVRTAGFAFVGLDLEGLESGRLNRLRPSSRSGDRR